ncbi:MAG: DUF4180 domain-containing protein [Spirochaetales bacterium]|nr:DUF4180 domain-containing protein [Spirochaetales bacterium]
MEVEIISSPKEDLSKCIMNAGEKMETASDFLSVIMSCPSPTVVINRSDLPETFFDLKTGVAGDFLQKVSNYRKS